MDDNTATLLGFALFFIGFPASWALIWAFCIAVRKWSRR